MPRNGVKQKVDIAVLHERVETIDKNVELILNNHLPHLQEEISDIKVRIAYWTGASAAVGVIIQTILHFLK